MSNAGGVNPEGCAAALQEVAKKAGVELNIATITGDDIMPQVLYIMVKEHFFILFIFNFIINSSRLYILGFPNVCGRCFFFFKLAHN